MYLGRAIGGRGGGGGGLGEGGRGDGGRGLGGGGGGGCGLGEGGAGGGLGGKGGAGGYEQLHTQQRAAYDVSPRRCKSQKDTLVCGNPRAGLMPHHALAELTTIV